MFLLSARGVTVPVLPAARLVAVSAEGCGVARVTDSLALLYFIPMSVVLFLCIITSVFPFKKFVFVFINISGAPGRPCVCAMHRLGSWGHAGRFCCPTDRAWAALVTSSHQLLISQFYNAGSCYWIQ